MQQNFLCYQDPAKDHILAMSFVSNILINTLVKYLMIIIKNGKCKDSYNFKCVTNYVESSDLNLVNYLLTKKAYKNLFHKLRIELGKEYEEICAERFFNNCEATLREALFQKGHVFNRNYYLVTDPDGFVMPEPTCDQCTILVHGGLKLKDGCLDYEDNSEEKKKFVSLGVALNLVQNSCYCFDNKSKVAF